MGGTRIGNGVPDGRAARRQGRRSDPMSDRSHFESAAADAALAHGVEKLARKIVTSAVGADTDARRFELACHAAEAQLDLMRVRCARLPLVAELEADPKPLFSSCGSTVTSGGRCRDASLRSANSTRRRLRAAIWQNEARKSNRFNSGVPQQRSLAEREARRPRFGRTNPNPGADWMSFWQ